MNLSLYWRRKIVNLAPCWVRGGGFGTGFISAGGHSSGPHVPRGAKDCSFESGSFAVDREVRSEVAPGYESPDFCPFKLAGRCSTPDGSCSKTACQVEGLPV
jgi:hypothetical protein